MKKAVTILVSSLVLVLGCMLINKLLNPDISYALDRKENLGSDDIFNQGDYFKTIKIPDMDKFFYNGGDLTINLYDNVLIINDHSIDNVSYVYEYAAIYEDELAVIGYTVNDEDYVLFYNYKLNKSLEIFKDDEMLVDFISGLSFDDDGITISFSNIKDNQYIKNNKDICKIKNNNLEVFYNILYPYNKDTKWIDNQMKLYSLNLLSYKNKYNLCR